MSVLASVFVWVLLVLVVPNVSPYLAAQLVRTPSLAALERDIRFMTDEQRDQIVNERSEKLRQRLRDEVNSGRYGFQVHWSLADPAPEEVKKRLGVDPEFRRRYEQIRDKIQAVVHQVNQEQQAKAERMYENYKAIAEHQFRLSRAISCASPLPPLVYALSELGYSGFAADKQYSRQAEAYWTGLQEYLQRRYKEEQRRNPSFSINDFLDVSTRPRFEYRPPRFAERMSEALPYLVMLGGWNLLLLAGATLGFQRFDVR